MFACSDYLDVRASPQDVLSAWCGIRPLPNTGKGGSTQNVVRDHGEPQNQYCVAPIKVSLQMALDA